MGLDAARVLGSRSRPDIGWIAKVSGRPVPEVERSLAGVEVDSGPVAELVDKILKSGRRYYAQFPAPLDLYSLVALAKPKTVVESGVASGVSSAFILMALRSNGRGTLHSIDLPVWRGERRGGESWAIPGGMSSGWAVPRGLKKGWDLREGRSEDLLKPLLKEVGTLGFYCHDSPVGDRHFEFEMGAIVPHLGPGSWVVADNTNWEVFSRTARSLGATACRRGGSSLGAFRVPPA